MNRRQERSAGLSRLGALHDDNTSFDREFWARTPPTERLALEADAANAARVYDALGHFGAPVQQLTTADLERPGTIFQIGVPPNRIDIVTAIDGVEFPEAWVGRSETASGGEVVPVIGRLHLIQNKRAAGRPQDLLDLEILESK